MVALSTRRYNGKHIKHSPNIDILLKIQRETTFLVKSSSPFISAYKRISKILDKFKKSSGTSRYRGGDYTKVKYVTVKGMGKSMEKTLSLALKFQNELLYKVDILTGSVEVLDEFKVDDENGAPENGDYDDDEDKESVFSKRMVSFVEARIWIKRDSEI